MRDPSHAARYARISNNFLHDMATGTWAAALLVLWLLARQLPSLPAEAAAALGDAMAPVFRLQVAALAALAVTGGVRLRYWRVQTPAEDVAAKRMALLVKHVGFLAVYGAGTVLGGSLLP